MYQNKTLTLAVIAALMAINIPAFAGDSESSTGGVTFSDIWPITCPIGVNKYLDNASLKAVNDASKIDSEKVCGCITGKMKDNSKVAPIFEQDSKKFEAFLKEYKQGEDYFKAVTYAYTMQCAGDAIVGATEALLTPK